MELDAFQRQIVAPQAHDLPLRRPGGDLEFRRKRLFVDRQRVVPHHANRTGQPRKHPLSVVPDLAGLTVHDASGADDGGSERVGDALVPQADPQDRKASRQPADDVARDSGVPAIPRRGLQLSASN